MFNFVTISFPQSNLSLQRIYSATYRQQNYEHDYARVKFRDWHVSPKAVKPGLMVQLSIEGKEYYGYVHDVKNYQDAQHNITEVGIIGASYVMRQASQKVYRNMTADQIVTQIAKKYRFSYKTTPHPRVFAQVSQAGLTDWEFMVKLAKQSGYFLRAENTSLYFQPLLQDFDELVYEAPDFYKADAGFKPVNPIYNFRPIIGETLAHHGADKAATSVAGVNPETGSLFKYTKQARPKTTRVNAHPELFDKHATNVVANSYTAAVSEAISADNKSSFPYSAEVEVYGTASIRPGMPIYLGNVGKDYSGYWTVLSVEHEVQDEAINMQMFNTRLIVGTDSLGEVANKSYPTTPPSRKTRHINPNVRNTRLKPKTVSRTRGVLVSPVKTSQLVDRTNRESPKNKQLSSSNWTATTGSLNSKPIPPGRSPAATAKVVANFARR